MADPCTQGERFTALEMTNKYMTEKIDAIEKKVDSIDTKINTFHEKFYEFLEKQEIKFANKRVETAMKAFIGVILLAVIGALMSLVLIK